MDYGNTKTPSMHRRLGSATLSQLAFPGEGNPHFLWEKSHWDNAVVKSKSKVKSKVKKKKKKEREIYKNIYNIVAISKACWNVVS